MPQVRSRLALLGMAAMHDHIDTVQSVLEEALIGFEFEGFRHNPCGIGQHAVFGDNGVTFDVRFLHLGYRGVAFAIAHATRRVAVPRASLPAPRPTPPGGIPTTWRDSQRERGSMPRRHIDR